MNQSLSRVVELIGIGVAGVIIAVAGVSVAVLIDCATFIIAAGIIYTIRVREKTTNTEGGKADVKGYLILVKEGMAYIGLVLIGKFVKNEAVMYVVLASMMTLVGIGIVIMSMFVNIQFMKIVDEKYLARVGAMANSLGESASPVVSFITSAVLGIININYMFVFLGLIILTFIASICIFRMQLEENDIGSNTVIENINKINDIEEISA